MPHISKHEWPESAALCFVYKGNAAVALSAETVEEGHPVRLFRKGLIKIGDWFKSADNLSFTVTNESLQHWARTFKEMVANAVAVPIMLGHTLEADKSRGKLVDVFVDGDELVGVLKMIGRDGIDLAHRTDVSIYSPPSYVDGKKNTYRWPITHVAVCVDPVITGLSEWSAVAASLSPALMLMDAQAKRSDEMDWSKIKAALGITEDMADKNAEALILSHVEKLAVDKKKVDDDMAALKLSHAGRTVDPLLVTLGAENRTARLNALVAGAKITKAVRDGLEGIFIGKDGAALSLTLSRAPVGDSDPDRFNALCLELAKNDVVVLKEQSGAQLLSLAGGGGAPGKADLVKDAEARAAAAKA